MSDCPQELAWLLPKLSTSPLEIPSHCHVVYFTDENAVAFGRALRTLASKSVIIGISLDYVRGEDPRQSGEAPLDSEFEDSLLARLAAFAAIAKRWGRRLETVGCHGTLALDVADDERCTQVLARTIQRYNPDLSLAIPAGHHGIAIAHHCGVRALREVQINWGDDQSSSLATNQNNSKIDRYRLSVNY